VKHSIVSTSACKIMVPIIKVVGNFCNLRCSYCFYNDKDQTSHQVISDKLLESFISQYMKLFLGKLVFIWHGGEPLLAGMSFFDKVINYQKKYSSPSHIIQNNIQTNGTLVTKKWAIFLKKHNFKVGVSLDGWKNSHDRFRKDKNGKGSFDRTVKGIKILEESGITPGIIQTITRSNIENIEQDFNFFYKKLKRKGWATNIYRDAKNENVFMKGQSITNSDLEKITKKYIDLWLKADDPDLQIREIENFISGVFNKRAPNCSFNGACTSFFCLEPNGEIYPCDRLSRQPEFLFGNLSKQKLHTILNGKKRLEYAYKVNSVNSDCSTCKWYNACHNGCTMHRIGGPEGKYYYCEARKKIFQYLKEKVTHYKEVTC